MSMIQHLSEAGMLFTVEKQPMQTIDPRTFGALDVAGTRKEFFANVRQDTGVTLGVVGSKYTNLQVQDAFEPLDRLVVDLGIELKSLHSWDGGAKVVAEVDVPTEVKAKREVGDISLRGRISTSFDGSGSYGVEFGAVRLICTNGMTMPEKGGVKAKVRHTASVEVRAAAIAKAIRQAEGVFGVWISRMEKLANTRMGRDAFDAFALMVFPNPVKEEASSARAESMRADLERLFHHGIGNHGDTAWDAYNALTEWTTHLASAQSTESRLASAWWGANRRREQQAFARLEVFVERGVEAFAA